MNAALPAKMPDNLHRLTGEQKLHAAFDLYWMAREIKAARLRQTCPDWSEERVQERVKEIFRHAVT